MKNAGFHLSLFGVSLILIWIGLFKFTPTEAKAIEPLVSQSPFMSWLYKVASVNGVSRIIGTIEVITGLLLLLSYWSPYAGLAGGLMASVTFILTLSFLFTTTNTISRVDGFILPDAFILKDIIALGVSWTVLTESYARLYKFRRRQMA